MLKHKSCQFSSKPICLTLSQSGEDSVMIELKLCGGLKKYLSNLTYLVAEDF